MGNKNDNTNAYPSYIGMESPASVARLVALDGRATEPDAITAGTFGQAICGPGFLSGLTKLRDWETTLTLFADEYHVPLLPP